MKCSRDRAIALQRIMIYLSAVDDYERRKKEEREAWKRVVEAVHNMTDYDRNVFERLYEKQLAGVKKNAASSVD